MRSLEHRINLSKALKNLKNTNPEAYQKMVKARDWTGRKHSEDSRKKMSESQKRFYFEHPEAKERLALKMRGKKTSDDIKIKQSLGMKRAYQRIIDEAEKLKQQGFKVIPITEVIPDIIAFKDGKFYAYEVEYGIPNYEKYKKNNYGQCFDDIVWLLKK